MENLNEWERSNDWEIVSEIEYGVRGVFEETYCQMEIWINEESILGLGFWNCDLGFQLLCTVPCVYS